MARIGDTGYTRAIALISLGQSRGARTDFYRLAMATDDEGLGVETMWALAAYTASTLTHLATLTGVSFDELLRAIAIAVTEDPNEN